jgi:hypothetical protein
VIGDLPLLLVLTVNSNVAIHILESGKSVDQLAACFIIRARLNIKTEQMIYNRRAKIYGGDF